MLRIVIFTLCLIFHAQTIHAAKPSVPMELFGEQTFADLSNKERTPEQIKHDILLTSRTLGWVPVAETDDSVRLRWVKNVHSVDVRVTFTTKTFKIDYVDSVALGYSVTPGGTALIHPQYNRWLRNLIKIINPAGYTTPSSTTAAEISDEIPDGFLAIHYYRRKRDWNGWGAHVWGNAFESDTSWFTPLQPAKIDAFGALFLAKASTTPPSDQALEANYILHNGDAKDQCGKDMSWDPKRSRKIYVVQNDCEVYYSLEDARKSRHYR